MTDSAKLASTMLGDNPEKSRNPLRKAMRRRNAKTVTFSDPTYYEPSENEFSTGDEGEEEPDFLTVADVAKDEGQAEQQETQNDSVEPLRIRTNPKENSVEDNASESTVQQNDGDTTAGDDVSRASSETYDHQGRTSRRIDGGVLTRADDSTKSNRKMRNTDSFYKDDSIETKKINLTPSLLRDDSNDQDQAAQPQEVRYHPNEMAALTSFQRTRSNSFESTEKAIASEKPKEERPEKRKEKKSGMFSLFKRKDRKYRAQSDDEDPDWLSKEMASSRRSPQPKVSSESLDQSTPSPQRNQPQRQISKLQKAPPTKSNSNTKQPASREDHTVKAINTSPPSAAPQLEQPIASSPLINPFDDEETFGREIVPTKPSLHLQTDQTEKATNQRSPTDSKNQRSPTESRARNVFSPIRDVLRPPANSEAKPEKVKKATSRMALEDSDTSPDEPQAPTTFPEASPVKENLSDSPVQVSPVVPLQPPPLVGDSSSQDERETAISPPSPSSTPELVERPVEESTSVRDDVTNTPASTIQSSRHAPQWSDAGLRTFLDGDNDIRDMLVVVHDTSDVKAPGPDHPVVDSFTRERSRVSGMENRLDGMLQDLLARRAGRRKWCTYG